MLETRYRCFDAWGAGSSDGTHWLELELPYHAISYEGYEEGRSTELDLSDVALVYQVGSNLGWNCSIEPLSSSSGPARVRVEYAAVSATVNVTPLEPQADRETWLVELEAEFEAAEEPVVLAWEGDYLWTGRL